MSESMRIFFFPLVHSIFDLVFEQENRNGHGEMAQL